MTPNIYKAVPKLKIKCSSSVYTFLNIMFRKGKKKIGGVTLSKRMNEDRGDFKE